MRNKVKDKIEKLSADHIMKDGRFPDEIWAEQCEKLLKVAWQSIYCDEHICHSTQDYKDIRKAIDDYEAWLDEQ